jgi:hypothetical protein
MAAPDPDVLVSGNPGMVEDVRSFLAADQIQTEAPTLKGRVYAYIGPPIIAGVPEILPVPAIFLDLLKVASNVVLAALLKILVESWRGLAKLSVSIKDQQGNLWTFQGTPRQVRAQIESVLGKRLCINCRSLVPLGNFCDVCGGALSY